MPRFDICCAHALLEWDYNVGGWLRERPSNQRRRAATSVQLSRMRFRPPSDLTFATLSEEGKYVYLMNVLGWNLPRDAQLNEHVVALFSEEWLARHYPSVFAELCAEPAL